MSARLPTGIGPLDRKLGGGIPGGSLVLLLAPPASQSEQFLSDLCETRRTLVLTTRRPRRVVDRSLSRSCRNPENIAVREVEPGSELSQVARYVRRLDERTNLMFDPLDPLEHIEENRYVAFLNTLRARVDETDSLAVFHCLNGESTPPNRDVTTYMADVVFDLSTSVRGERLENRLSVPKFRGGDPFEEAMRLELASAVSVDTSRDIG